MAYGDNTTTITATAKVLPAEIQKTLSATLTCGLAADNSEKWYYKLTKVSNSSTDLIAGNFLDNNVSATAASGLAAITTSDVVKFLFIKNLDTAKSIYFVLDAGTAASTADDGMEVGPGSFFAAKLTTGVTVARIHAISSTGDCDCLVAAIIDDV